MYFSFQQIFDIETKQCQDTTEDNLAQIVIDPIMINLKRRPIKKNKTVDAAQFGFPTCTGQDELLVLKPYQGRNSDYYLFFDEKDQELGLRENCQPDLTLEPGQNQYCFDHSFDVLEGHKNTVAVICGQPKTCIRTCCPEGQYLNPDPAPGGPVCINYSTPPEQPLRIQFQDDPEATYQTFVNIPCRGAKEHEDETSLEWQFQSNGFLFMNLQEYPYHQYCLSFSETGPQTYRKEVIACPQPECQGPYLSWQCTVDFTLMPILMGFSVFFLVILQGIIWSEKKAKLYECLQLCNIAMLTLVYITLIIVKVVSPYYIPDTLCVFIGIVFHYSYTSALFWLSTMAYFMFRSFQAMKDTSAQRLQRRKYGFFHPDFKFYALYAFGCPAIVSIVTLVLQHVPNQDSFIAPRIGEFTCLLGQSRGGLDNPHLWYFNIINIFPTIAILVFFGIFLWQFLGYWSKNTDRFLSDKEKAKKRRQRMKVVVKMFLVMGLTWVADQVSWMISEYYGDFEKFLNKGLLYSELFCDCINSSMVSFIF